MSANYVAELRVGNKYRLGRKIGSGSFGDIYLGERWTERGEVVANAQASARAAAAALCLARLPAARGRRVEPRATGPCLVCAARRRARRPPRRV